MKCIMCGARIKPLIEGSIKRCPVCHSIIGKVINTRTITKIQVENTSVINMDLPKEVKGKYQPHLVLGSLTRAVARVREYGVKKYHGENGWKQQTPQDYMDAIGRHYDSCRNDPQARDDESGLLHIAQIATSAMFIIDMLKEQGVDLDTMKERQNGN